MTFRSLNHPMFGGLVACFYDYLLGIHCDVGGENLTICPIFVDSIGRLSGYRTLPQGKVSVAYEKKQGKIVVNIEVPSGVNATFLSGDERHILTSGENLFELPCNR